MKKYYFAFCLIFSQFIWGQHKPVPIIFDSDMGPDYDDVGAITVLHALADSGYTKILAMCSSSKYEGVAAVFNVFNTYFGKPDIIIGTPRGNASKAKDWQHWTDTILAKYPHQIKKNDETPDAVEVYRKILASQPNHSVTIVTVGFMTNLANLLSTKADKYSPLSGKELIKKKVNLLVSMAGKFPTGREYNIFSDSISSKKVFEQWPTDVLFDGFEIGEKIKTGLPLIKNENIQNSPVKDVFNICIPKSKGDAGGRMSWDEITVLVAVKGYKPWFTTENGKIIINSDGSNKWEYFGKRHSYIKFEKTAAEVENLLNGLMMYQPKKKGSLK
jgi:pyrimidine-specific ribonucleoside hydrolase